MRKTIELDSLLTDIKSSVNKAKAAQNYLIEDYFEIIDEKLLAYYQDKAGNHNDIVADYLSKISKDIEEAQKVLETVLNNERSAEHGRY
ncbi:hypothetical protein [Ohessyouella blattaphilus]|uniref:Uncharacterized protein n=1 Tax=Ohessyouella blattaphilus TaxID=2949333 RepID=A0ABT1EHY8_9FIRM|nr:hypothetical protein [Ohessyouella blattaphilus]MCP1110321.1 hypothetical protein [Ohessyouella blattaphilus]MCR8563715.1 hypothetical protein [Ohessyouella blattaphilus]